MICVVLAVSASYELIEWGAALALGQGADEFLGTQGDPWDTQSDMFFALMGAVSALLLLSPCTTASSADLPGPEPVEGRALPLPSLLLDPPTPFRNPARRR